jgi:hypothetical protein
VATVTTLAVHEESARCTYCQNFHKVRAGGPAAALAAAIRYLDAYHEGDHLQKVQSDIRGLDPNQAGKAVPMPVAGNGALRTAPLAGKA